MRPNAHLLATTAIGRITGASLLTLVLVFSTMLQGCKRDKEKGPVLAQVGTATLTLAELRESFPPEFEQLIRREQYLDFIKRWIDDEVIYQQAQKANLAKDSTVARKLAKVRRKLLIEEFLARENTSEVFEPDEMAMSQYYEMHKEDFRRKVPEVKFIHLRVQTVKQAADLRGKINRSDFLAVATSNSLDPAPESYASIVFKKQSEFPSCLTQEISTAGIGTLSMPIVCPDGAYLVRVLERQEAGSLIPFAEAKEEISGILVMSRKDKLLDGRIAKYKEGLAIGYNVDQIPGQAEVPKGGDSQTVAAAKPTDPSKPVAKAPETGASATPTASTQPGAQSALVGKGPQPASGTPHVESMAPVASVVPAPRRPARKHVANRAPASHTGATDSGESRAASPSAKAAEPASESAPTPSTGAKPESEENSNAQKPEATP